MIRHFSLSYALIASLAVICVTVGWADEFAVGPQSGVILLRNGSTLRGMITPAGDRYIVSFDKGGVARVPTSDVELLCRDLEQAYQHKRQSVGDHLTARLELARWCLQHKLHARAADQLLAAESEHGPHPELERLHQRLLLAFVQPGATRTAKPQIGSQDKPVKSTVSLADLPRGALEEFTSTVQPLLLNRCAASGCHGGRGDASYVLLRPSGGRPLTSRITERNLAATLNQTNYATPAQSPLLVKALQVHGSAESPALLERETRYYELLAKWVTRVSPPREAELEKVARRNEVLFQARTVGSARPDGKAPGSQAEERSEGDSSPSKAAADDYEPVDPFDPEIFNRRYHRDDDVPNDARRE
jgi:hypothetical protein